MAQEQRGSGQSSSKRIGQKTEPEQTKAGQYLPKIHRLCQRRKTGIRQSGVAHERRAYYRYHRSDSYSCIFLTRILADRHRIPRSAQGHPRYYIVITQGAG